MKIIRTVPVAFNFITGGYQLSGRTDVRSIGRKLVDCVKLIDFVSICLAQFSKCRGDDS